MAIVVLVLWLFTAGAGFYLLVTSNLGRARPAATGPAAEPAAAAPATAPATASVATPATQAAPSSVGRCRPPPCRPPAPRRLPRNARCGGRRGTGSTRPR